MKTVFVAGTDTGVGKTFFCAHLLKYLLNQGIVAGYQKWVSTGDAEQPADLDFCIRTAGPGVDAADIDNQVPFRFPFPASPHLAAELAGREVNAEAIVRAFKTMAAKYELLLVEGVGGLLVPLRRDLLLIDLLARLRPPVLLVAKSGLGTLNHTLLSLETLRRRNIPVIGVVFSDPPDPGDEILIADNMKTIAELGAIRVFGRLYRTADHGEPQATHKIFAAVSRAIPENFQID
jgi:dethiobiotin synthetase